ncbi:MAG: extracellular solute-binding protein [Verrucomicrobia bacterium]|jgi:putative spermidine/putrescine transport system substrate-binding protein|nr:extracellular solute-binding protein [Verrucomicrobiota bacterium]
MRRCNRQSKLPLRSIFSGLLLLPGLFCPAAEPLRIATWGGAYEAAQRRALFEPFEEQTGRRVEVLQHNGTLRDVEERAEREGWDIVDMTEDMAHAACRQGLLRTLDHERIFGETSKRQLERDLAPLRLSACAIPQNVYAHVLAYDDRAFPGLKPTRVEDFFDTERFPGKRAVQKTPDALLEWALLAEGVPQRQVYDLLSTDRGLRLALRKIETIRDDIIWWEDPAEPARLLERGVAVMASGYNGRFFFAVHDHDAPIVTIWDGQLIGTDVWTVVQGADSEAVLDFLRFAMQSERMAHLAEWIPYGPARTSALDHIGLHPDTAVPMREHLPNARLTLGRHLIRDPRWDANTQALRDRRFRNWLRGEGE